MALKKISSVVVLGIDSNYEPVTAAGEKFRGKRVYPKFMSEGAEVRRLIGQTATRSDFVVEANEPDIDYITGVGHGSYDTYTGHHGNPILRVNRYNPSEVRGRVIHLLSCQTARLLGPDLVRNGVKAFFGYNENFIFSMPVSNEFFECDSQIDLVLASGRNVSLAHSTCIASFNHYIDEYKQLGQFRLAAMFETDRDRLRSPVISKRYGDPNSVIS